MGTWAEVEHTADRAVWLQAGNIEDLLLTAASALYALLTRLDDVVIDQNCIISDNVLCYEGAYDYRGIQLGYIDRALAGPVISGNSIATNAQDKGDAIHSYGIS